MSWFKVCDTFSGHAKVRALRKHGKRVRSDALALWVLAGSECARALKDGGVVEGFVSLLDLEALAYPLDAAEVAAAAAALVDVGLWELATEGHVFHDWAEYQPTAERERAKRDDWRDQKAAQRAAKAALRASQSSSAPKVSAGVSADVSAPDIVPDKAPDSAPDKRKSPRRSPPPCPALPDPDPDPDPLPDPISHGGSDPIRSGAPRVTRADLSTFGIAMPAPGPIEHLVAGFAKRWNAKRDARGKPLGAGWPGLGAHSGKADAIAKLYASDLPALERALDGYFASSDPFVVGKARWNFATFAADPGKWSATLVEPAFDAAATLAKIPVIVDRKAAR